MGAVTVTSAAQVLRRYKLVDLIAAIIAISAAILVLVEADGPVAEAIVTGTALLVPGIALRRWTAQFGWAGQAALTVIASAAVQTVLALLSVWVAWWHPRGIAAVVFLLAAVALIVQAVWLPARAAPAEEPTAAGRRRHVAPGNGGWGGYAYWAIWLVAVACWVVSIVRADVSNLGDWGLVGAVGPFWYAALALVVGLCLVAITVRRVSDVRMAASVTVLVSMLYGASTVLEPVPRLPWVYKHIAVTSYIQAHGSVDVGVDIYQRWPGFFSFMAYVGTITRVPDPVSYAAWAEPVFALIDTALVLAIARAIWRDPRFCWTAALLFSLTNWIGQNYYSPQAFAFSLYLAVCLIFFTALRRRPRRLGLMLEAVIGWLARLRRRGRPSYDELIAPARRGRDVYPIAAIMVLHAVIVASHQLTPYMVIIDLVLLLAFGYFRTVWLAVALVVLTGLYLAPNFDYIQQHFGLFSGIDPIANATYTPVQVTRIEASVWQAHGARALTVLTFALALAGLARRAWRGYARSSLVIAWLCFAPVLILAAQSYGGEGRLRVVLFALPWTAAAGAWLFWPSGVRGPARPERGVAASPDPQPPAGDNQPPSPVTWRGRLAISAAVTVLTAVFVPTYLQPEADDQVTSGDVAAAQWLDGQVASGDVVLSLTPTFPSVVGSHYNLIVNGIDSLSDIKKYYPSAMQPADVTAAVTSLGLYGQHAFVVFSAEQETFAARHGLFQAGELDGLQSALGHDTDYAEVYDRRGVTIFELR